MEDDDELEGRHHPANRSTATSKLRRGGKHCPACAAPLEKNAVRTRLMRQCRACGAHPQQGKFCRRCRAENVWQGRHGAGCVTCGLHGAADDVITRASAAAK